MSEIFNKMAMKYDNPERLKVADYIINEIKKQLTFTQQSILTDYGCGTGTIGIALSPYFDKVILADSAEKMLEMAQNKYHQQQLTNISIECVSQPIELSVKSDVMILSQTLLHIPDTYQILQQCYEQINSQLIIVDFVKNPLVYHEKVHNGFDLKQLHHYLTTIGFTNIQSQIFYQAPKLLLNEEASMFCLVANK